MKIEKRDGSKERRILIALITNDDVLGRIAAKWQKDMFSSQFANIIAGWCVDFFNKYGKAPGKSIEVIFQTWAENHKDKDSTRLVEKFLTSLSGEYSKLKESVNAELVMDLAKEYFLRVKVSSVKDAIEGYLDMGSVDKAVEAIQTYSGVELGLGEGEDLFNAKDCIQSAFTDRVKPLIEYTEGLKFFFGTSLQREGFISFMGPDKSGKSFWLTDIAYRALLQRNKVAFFEVGDMSKDQLKMRFMVRCARHPYISPGWQWPYEVKIPKGIVKASADDIPCVTHGIKVFNEPLDPEMAWKACEYLMSHKVRSKESYFKLSCHPNSSINVKGIESILTGWERIGFIPDVIVVDYADILASPESSRNADTRDQINTTWKQLRALAQRRHALVVTATQTNTAAYTSDVLGRENFSEDKRKLSHVTGMVGINVTSEEKSIGVCRVNWVVLREGEFNSKKMCYVAQCLPLANPSMRSIF